MPAAVQTKSRGNRVKLFKKFYRHSTPNFRCYHGSRWPPRASFEGMWPHSKFLSSGIKWGRPVTEASGKVQKLLEKKLKAQPKKRQKRGILKRKETGRKKAVHKTLKPTKFVSFGKKKSYYKRRAQKEQLYDPDTRYTRAPDVPLTPAQQRERMVGARGDPKTTFKLDPQGRLIQVARRPGLMRIV